MIKFIGLTGPTGAGKGEAAKILSKMGFYHFDCDKIYHELLIPPSKCLDEIRECFGSIVFLPSGELDRKALSEIVFSEEGRAEKLPLLNSVTHKYVLQEVRTRAARLCLQGYNVFIMDAPLLFESGFDAECEFVISVLADKETRIERIIARDLLESRESAEARVNAQPSDDFYLSRSSYTIYNTNGIAELEKRLTEIIGRAENWIKQ